MNAVLHVASGLVAGAISSVLPGPCNALVIAAACRGGRARATATGLGVAVGDTAYAALGAAGIGAVLARHPVVPTMLRWISGAVAVGYGVWLARARAVREKNGAGGGFASGLALIAANPAALLTWVFVAGWLAAGDAVAAICEVVAIGAGSAMGYAMVARAAVAYGSDDDARAARIVRIAGALLVAAGVCTLVEVAPLRWTGSKPQAAICCRSYSTGDR